MTSNLEWNVFYYSINSQKIIEFNIFEHSGFLKDVEKCFKQCENKEDFAKEIKSSLMYYFWAKSEYEIIISAWCGGNGEEAVKIDIYHQVMMNWDKFIDYLWRSAMVGD